MSARAIQDHKTLDPETFVHPAVHCSSVASDSPQQVSTNGCMELGSDRFLERAVEKQWGTSPDRTFARRSATPFAAGLQQSEFPAQRPSPRIAFKVKGRIIFMDLAEIVAVQAAGGYVSLQHQPNPYLLRESLSSIAEKLKPYGFIRIHRSVIVNALVVEEIQPLQTGEYKLRVKGGMEYTVARKYKDNLRHLAQLWLGSAPGERPKSS